MSFTLRAEQSSFKFVPDKFSQQQQKSNQTNFAGSKIEQLFYSWPERQNTGRVL